MSFELKASAFQDAPRGDIVRLNVRLDAMKAGDSQRPPNEERNRPRGKASATDALDQPIAEVGRSSLG